MFAKEGDDDFRWELAVQHCPNQCWEREVLSHHPRILHSASYAGHISRMCARSSGGAVVALRDRLLAYNDTSTPSLLCPPTKVDGLYSSIFDVSWIWQAFVLSFKEQAIAPSSSLHLWSTGWGIFPHTETAWIYWYVSASLNINRSVERRRSAKTIWKIGKCYMRYIYYRISLVFRMRYFLRIGPLDTDGSPLNHH